MFMLYHEARYLRTLLYWQPIQKERRLEIPFVRYPFTTNKQLLFSYFQRAKSYAAAILYCVNRFA